MFNFSYPFDYLGTIDTLVPNPTSKATYRFSTPYRRYQVSFETYDFSIVAVKYCDMDDRNAGNRYEKIFNDGDAFKVISTCLHIMVDYWRRNPDTTFCFYAVPRTLNEAMFPQLLQFSEEKAKAFVDRFRKTRYAIYNYAMINLFNPADFVHVRDKKNCVYVLVNQNYRRKRTLIKRLGKYLLLNYYMIFEPEVS